MARRRGGSSGKVSRSRSRSPPPQKAVAASSHPVHKSSSTGSVLGGIGGAIADGLGWGAGMEMAHRAVDAVFGPRTVRHETVAAPQQPAAAMTAAQTADGNACGGHSKALQDCLSSFGADISKCQVYMDMLAECRNGSSSSGGFQSA
ncbi:unnamed protein product [Linum tenue]|uniref:CHCH domain-containing protein n=1 Tax=Linum tenue TaxID=586396 RepID=A0AAV0NZR6_9ROSI|nr:unnamed protein product [Linum tenue]